jgi:hypothetical protein
LVIRGSVTVSLHYVKCKSYQIKNSSKTNINKIGSEIKIEINFKTRIKKTTFCTVESKLEANLEAKMKEIKLNKIMKEKQASLPKTQ